MEDEASENHFKYPSIRTWLELESGRLEKEVLDISRRPKDEFREAYCNVSVCWGGRDGIPLDNVEGRSFKGELNEQSQLTLHQRGFDSVDPTDSVPAFYNIKPPVCL